MKSYIITILTGLAALPYTTAETTATSTDLPKSTEASAFLSDVLSVVPTWATGAYATSLASGLYSVDTSFIQNDKYTSVINAIWSAAEAQGGDDVVASLSSSYWNWGDITTNSWYTANVPQAYQTEVLAFDAAWDSVYTSVAAHALETSVSTSASKGVAAVGLPKCTGMVQAAGLAAGVAVAVAGVV